VYITVTGASTKRARLALGKLHPARDAKTQNAEFGQKMETQIREDMEFSGIFEILSREAFAHLDDVKDLRNPRYGEWAPLGVTFVLKLAYKLEGTKAVLDASLYDVPGEKQIFGNRYQHPAASYPRLVHALTEDILKALTGEHGLFFSRLAMICRTPPRRGRPAAKEVFVVGADGNGFMQLTADHTITLSPGWSPDGKYLTYTQFEVILGRKRGTVLKRHNVSNGERTVLSAKEGMNSGASWSPNGKKIAMTLSITGRPELYLVGSDGNGSPEPLSRSIQWRRVAGEGFQPSLATLLFDVEPSWNPIGDRIVFSSARTGHPMIYIVDVATRVATQLTFAGQYNATPAWSSRGDKIVFAAQRTGEGNFDLYLIDADGNNLERLTSGDNPSGRRFNNENPSWAPTGRHLAYASSEGGQYAVYAMNLDGTAKRRLSPPNIECSMPTWGPAEK
jgi:TolB protein